MENQSKKRSIFLVYNTDSSVLSVKAGGWKVRDGKFLCFLDDGEIVHIFNFNNIFGFIELDKEKEEK